MKNSLIIATLKSLGLFVFGQPLYEQKETLHQNVTGKVEKDRFGGDVLRIEHETNQSEFTLVRIRAGVPLNKPAYDIVKFVAKETRSGKTKDGVAWTVNAGRPTAFAM